VVGVVAREGQGLAVIFGSLTVIAAGLVDHAETVIAVMDVGEALQQFMGGLLRRVELSSVDEIEDTVGCGGQFVVIVAQAKMIWVRFEHRSGEGLALGLLDLRDRKTIIESELSTYSS